MEMSSAKVAVACCLLIQQRPVESSMSAAPRLKDVWEQSGLKPRRHPLFD